MSGLYFVYIVSVPSSTLELNYLLAGTGPKGACMWYQTRQASTHFVDKLKCFCLFCFVFFPLFCHISLSLFSNLITFSQGTVQTPLLNLWCTASRWRQPTFCVVAGGGSQKRETLMNNKKSPRILRCDGKIQQVTSTVGTGHVAKAGHTQRLNNYDRDILCRS